MGKLLGERLRRYAAEKSGVRKFKPLDLGFHRFDDLGIAMPQAGNRGATRGVEIMLPGTVDDVNAVTLYR